ncbi:MAG: DUF1295 domain-containing protein [Wenzhouxiangellaceae bacterium]|nr:DUF1295 domain-containing protein [Wenzhouxiangellaceae bacterium]
MTMLWISLAACVLVMTALWIWQRGSGRADWVDVAWAALIGLQAVAYALLADGTVEKRVLVVLVTGTWSFRLTWHLARRVGGHDEEDGRYKAMREHWGDKQQAGMFAFFMAQALVAWLFSLPAWVVASDPTSALDAWVLVGVTIWLVSIAGESIADRQLARFKADPSNSGEVCDEGLWRYSRHPNYFFEWLHWFAYPLIAMGAPHLWLAWLGPLVMLVFLLFLSGIPYAEKQSLKSRGEAYREYQRRTSPFIPWSPKDDG